MLLALWAPAQQGRYIVALNDGRIVSGDKLTGWHAPGLTVRLDGHVATAPGEPLLWMRDASLKPWLAPSPRGGFVEFVGGDRIVGGVIGGQDACGKDGMYVPAHLLVRPTKPKHTRDHEGASLDIVRVLPDRIKRVVLGPELQVRLQPGNAFGRNGSRMSFVGIRWRGKSVLLLTKTGTRTVLLADIAEVHMPRTDPWEAYYRQLAAISPACRSNLIRIETNDGLIATGSESRFGAVPFAHESMLPHSIAHRRNLVSHIKHLEERLLKSSRKIEETRAHQKKRIADHDREIRKVQSRHGKALGELKAQLEKQRRDAAARSAAKRKKLQESFRKSIAEIKKNLTAAPQAQSEAKRKRAQAAKVLKAAEQALEREESNAQAAGEASLKRLQAVHADELKRLAQTKATLAAAMARSDEAAARGNKTYLSQLASGKARLAVAPTHEGSPSTWYHMIHPVWSLDPLWVPFKTIVMRWESRPTTVPLSRVEPAETLDPAMLRWCADRNVDGGPLRSGGRLYGWGFGVHAHSELRFMLPSSAVAFNTRLGLDRVVDTGGCARGKVFLGSTKTEPAYQSPLLIGSAKTVWSGAIPIRRSAKAPITLILQADPIGRDHPPQAEPLNIRDKLNWLEPQLSLDLNRLRSEVSRHIAPTVLAWRRWTPTFDKHGVYAWRTWLARPARHERESFLPVLGVKARPLKLSREMTIADGDKWLVVDVGFPDGADIRADAVTLRVGDANIPAQKLPIRQYWRRRTAPLVFSLAKYRGKKIKLELTQRPEAGELYWRAVGTSNKLPEHYRLARFLESIGRKDMQITRGLDLALQSGGIGKRDALSALKIMERGGTIGFCCKTEEKDYGYMHCVMVGHGWIGGEKTFRELKDVGWLRFLIICQENGFSKKLMKEVAQARQAGVWLPRRTPSTYGGISYSITLRNRSNKKLAIFQINRGGGMNPVDQVEPGGRRILHTHEAFRYEAYVLAKKYDKTQPVSRLLIKGETVWEIK